MLRTFTGALTAAAVDTVCGAPCGAVSEQRTNSRDGYRHRDVDTPMGTPKDAVVP